jgi:phosphate starvation-inducible protein PhoH
MARRLTRKQRRQMDNETDHIMNTKFSMKRITPMTETQKLLFESYRKGKNIIAIGSAGTGKTYVSLYLALEDILGNTEYEKVIIVRSAVQSREQGFMPGSLNEKMSFYETPYVDIVNDLFGRGDAYQILKQKNMLQFMSTSFVRGLTFDNAIIIVDESQSCNFHELDSVITRVGEGSKIIFCGDTKQDDLKHGGKNRIDVSGLKDFVNIVDKIDLFEIVKFNTNDIVRSGLVKKYLIMKEELEAV